MVMLPLESVEVTGTGIATGAIGRVETGVGERVMTMLLDAGAGGGPNGWPLSAGGAFNVGVSAVNTILPCWAGGVLGCGAAIEVGPSSGSVDVEVFVRYNAVSSANGPKAGLKAGGDPQFQIPRSGNNSSTVASPDL